METALLTVQNDIVIPMANQFCTALWDLTLLDLSEVFNTIDHQILLDRLKEWFGLGGDVLEWAVSYLKHLFRSAQISSIRYNLIELIFGVPQGSGIGPLLFIMYTTPLSSVLFKAKDIKHHLYADDTQVHNSFNTSSFNDSIKIFKTPMFQSKTGCTKTN